MRTLILAGWVLFLLVAAAAPAHIENNGTGHEDKYSKLNDHRNTFRALMPGNSRGVAFNRYHPETGIFQSGPDTSLNGEWFLQPALPSDTAAGQFPSINFNLKKKIFSGNTGCNTMNGSFVITDSSLHFNDNLRVTRKVCTGYNEAAFLKNLFMANRYTIEDSVMILWFNQTELSRWTRKPERELKIKKA
ncbi:MAG: META domain-containing protein [Chitinophagaceae bacterium]|nr:META domain-containing protein [Chitinophagaceae bacterium]